ncbi:hypothetical protein [Pseudobacter ginsenosidimutans]|jgi:glutamate decarboxylase|uniref:hypothetical protein n=1 Tax=Pseudobacter ginsenosidimutans TaxID=661488 RepID=UPI00102DFCA8|nr:hypothetical protein [Pseudobacter ginsenosidimutans]QEC43608.1 hypothetical protein FSB84_18665 [Pseudobacter ginsenosidimutans]
MLTNDHAAYIAGAVGKMGYFDLLYDGRHGWPGACWTMKQSAEEALGFNLYDISDKIRSRGWQIASYPLTGTASDITAQRVLVRHGFSRDMADMLIEDHKRSIDYLSQNPPRRKLTREEAGGYSHQKQQSKAKAAQDRAAFYFSNTTASG